MNIVREMISHSEGPTSYRMRVASFKNKMKTWASGRKISSKDFKVDGVKLRIQLFPNGEDQEVMNHISFYIHNYSGVDIDLLCDVKMGSKVKFDDNNFHIKAESGWGWKRGGGYGGRQ